jgi:hypothetical protein
MALMTAIDETTRPADPVHTGIMHTLDRSGDVRVMWDKDNPDEVAAARETFNKLTRGRPTHLAYRAVGKRGSQGEQMREFDPEAERIILVQAPVGG